jgi:uncharacterized protein (DUF2147 family)
MLKLMRLAIVTGAFSLSWLVEPTLAGVGMPYGLWSMGNVTVKVADCGGKLCGNIVALSESGRTAPKLDHNNPDASKRNRPLIGLAVLIGMKPAGSGEWRGFIYNPLDGNTYSATISVIGNTLSVNGCFGGSLCKTNKFARR